MNWYEDDALWNAFYEHMFAEESFEMAHQQSSELLVLANHEVKDILDLACGPGRHCIALSQLGCNVTGVDISPFLLSQAKQNIQSKGLNVQLIESDMSCFSQPDSFDLIVNMFNSFGYLPSHEENFNVIQLAYQNLRKSGTLIIDTVGKETLARNIQPVHLTEYEDGSIRIERPLLTDDLQVFSNEWILIDGDKVFRREYQHYIYTPLELTMMCEKAGFNNVEVYGSLSGDEYDLDSEQLVIVAEKY